MGAPHASDPYLDTGMEGFIRSLARKEYWRVAAWYGRREVGLDDLVQDGYLCYAKCRHRYVNVLGSLPAHPTLPDHRKMMQELVRTAFTRYIRFVVAGHMRWGHEVPACQFATQDNPSADPWETLLPAQPEEVSFLALVRSMPAELQQLMVLLAGDGAEALGFQRSRLERRLLPSGAVRIQKRGRRRLRETTNEYYCRLLGLDPLKVNIRAQLAAFLRGEDTEIADA